MQVVFSHATGNANVRAAAKGLREANLLAAFHTTLASFPGSLLDQLGGLGPLAEIRRRRYDPALRPVATAWPWREAARLAAAKAGLTSLIKHETGPFCVDAVYRTLDRQVGGTLPQAAAKGIKAVYGYEDGAATSFQEAKSLGLQCLYDLPTGYWRAARRLLADEQQRWPAWAVTITGLNDSEAKLARKDAELRMADRIFVASTFTANTLQDYPGALPPIEIIPYGFPDVQQAREYRPIANGQKIKLLFVGKLSQQKGLADLFAAVEPLKEWVELTVVGQKPNVACAALDAALARHRWIPTLPHAQVLELMRQHDVFVFPSLFDGFGLVITEAMSQGTPVIATNRSAGPDLIRQGDNGWLVEASAPQALQAQIEELIRRPEAIAQAGKAASETARNRPWRAYSQELTAAVQRHLAAAE